MLNPYFFTDKNLNVGFQINLDSHHISHANSKLTMTPSYPEVGIEVSLYQKNLTKELSVIYAD